jgi:PAS domain S-box-containing protein
MQININQLSIATIIKLSKHIKEKCTNFSSFEEITQELMRVLYSSFVTDGRRSPFVLARFFKSCAYDKLPDDIKNYIHNNESKTNFISSNKYLTLLGSFGELDNWKNRYLSKNYKAFPIHDERLLDKFPMLSAVFDQMGINLSHLKQTDKSIIIKDYHRQYSVFCIENAEGSNLIPKQAEFVRPYSVKSVFGFGGTYSTSNVYAVIIFSRERLSKEDAQLFLSLNPVIKQITLAHEITGNVFKSDRKYTNASVDGLYDEIPTVQLKSHNITISSQEKDIIEKEMSLTSSIELEMANEYLLQMSEALNKSHEQLEDKVRKRTRELNESREQIKLLLNSTGEAIYGLDNEGNCNFSNIACLRILGYKDTSHLLGKNMHDLIHHSKKDGTHYPIQECCIYEVFREGKGTQVDYEVFWRADGTSFPVEYMSYPIRKYNKIIGAVVTFSDITKHKQFEEKLYTQNSYLRLLNVAAVAANESVDIKDAFLPVLKEICSYTGWEMGHAYAISENNPDLLKPTEVWCLEEKKQFIDFCDVTKKTDFARGVGLPGRVLASCKPHWIVDVRTDKGFLRAKIAKDLNLKSGIAFPVMVGSSVVAVLEFFTTKKEEPDQWFMDIMADVGTQLGRIVERMQAKEAEDEFKRIFDLSIDLICIVDPESNFFTKVNPAFGKTLGYSDNELLTKPIFDFIHPDDRNKTLDIIQEKLLQGISVINFENRYICKDGSYKWLIWNSTTSSNFGTTYSIGHDITERKNMEEALIQSEKMKAMGIMTAGVVHEFNNILAVISSNAQLLEETNRSNKGLSKSLNTICRMADDGAEIVDRMYDFTNVTKDTSHYISVDMNDLIKQVIGFTMPRWKEMAQANGITYQIIRKGVKTLPSVLGSPSELRETILNIINNALDAMPKGGVITVSTRYVLSKQSGVESKKDKVSKLKAENSELKSDFIEISFADTGNGMTHEVEKKMFDPFFTTRSPEGTGLGMSISYGIIARHGGEIKVESELGKGTVIYLSLPVDCKPAPHVVTSIQDEKLNVDGLNILVVDDKEEVSDSLGKIFKDDGHKVCNVYNGSEAIKLLKKNNYDLLICDLIMPDVNGRDIVNSIKTMKKRPKVGLITGWKYKIEDAEKEGLEVDFIVKKPFNLSRLRRDINDLWV